MESVFGRCFSKVRLSVGSSQGNRRAWQAQGITETARMEVVHTRLGAGKRGASWCCALMFLQVGWTVRTLLGCISVGTAATF